MKVGTCGFCMKRSNIYKDLDVVEIQNTFYDFVNESWLKGLREEAGDFEFTFKAIQIITHKKNSKTYRRFKSIFGNKENYGNFRDNWEINNAMDKMLEYAKILNAKIMIFQTPPSFSECDENIENLMNFFKKYKMNNITYGLELRGNWKIDTLKYIYENLGIIHVVDPFYSDSVSEGLRYFRLHGKGGYSYSYTMEDFIYLKNKIKDNDYIMFNNTNMCEDAKKFKAIIHGI
ncbi:MAG: DUF72 domain-containing protein [Thermoplasmata archaeon]